MKTHFDLAAWLAGSEAEFGDPAAATGNLYVRFLAAPEIIATREPGVCRSCRCTETAPCSPPCLWADAERTLCSACDVVTARWSGQTLFVVFPAGELPIKINADGPLLVDDSLDSFGVEKITESVWALEPSLNIPDLLHVFVTLYDVPSPAPWQSRIISA